MANPEVQGRIAHDLKAALSPIRTSAYVLRQGKALPDATHRELVDVIERHTVRMARMVDEALDWQRAVMGTIVSRRAPQDVAMLLDLTTGALDTTPSVSWPGGPVPDVDGDRQRLEQMLGALIGYCTQRDPAAPTEVEITSQQGWVHITIRDRGPDSDVGKLLETPLYNAPDGGLGLGILLANAIAEAHGGSVKPTARAGGGLCFDCTLPAVARSAN